MIKGFGGKCQCCGYDKCMSALDFHHLDPTKKELTLSSSIVSWEKTKQELEKCICVCANCHREIHEGIRKVDITKKYFDKSLVEDYDPSPTKYQIWDSCPVCGNKKIITHKYCSKKCACSQQRKYDWSKFDIVDLIDNKNINVQDIANRVGCSWNAVKKKYNKLKLSSEFKSR